MYDVIDSRYDVDDVGLLLCLMSAFLFVSIHTMASQFRHLS